MAIEPISFYLFRASKLDALADEEARTVSAALRQFPQLYSSRVTYHLIYTTSYLLNSDGTKIRTNHSLAAI